MPPIRLHLDTSDYAAMYCAPPGPDAAKVRDFLKGTAEVGKIQIGLSYHVALNCFKKQRRNIEKTGSHVHDSLSNCVVRTPFRTPLIWDKGMSFRLRAYGYLASSCTSSRSITLLRVSQMLSRGNSI